MLKNKRKYGQHFASEFTLVQLCGYGYVLVIGTYARSTGTSWGLGT